MKLIGERIHVRCEHVHCEHGPGETDQEITVPVAFFWRGRFYQVQAVQVRWRWRGAWWTTPYLRGHERVYYRVLCAPQTTRKTQSISDELCMELYVERGHWTLSRLLD